MTVTILVPALNELKGLSIYLPRIERAWYDDLIVLDGKSSDGTVAWCLKNHYKVYQQQRTGLWNAYKEVFDLDLIKTDIVITFSPDGNSPPEAIPRLIKKMKQGYDMVIASRYMRRQEGNDTSYCIESWSADDSTLTHFGNWLYTGIVNLRSGFHYTDALVMYRAYRKDVIKTMGFQATPTPFQRWLISMTPLYSWEPSLSIRLGRIPLRIGEIPVNEPKALRPRRQVTAIHAFAIGAQILHEGWFR